MYDKEAVYDEKISPLMTEIINICKENNISMFADFYLREKTNDDGEFRCTTVLNFEGNKSERITDMYNIAYNGYVAEKPFFMAMTVTRK